MTTILSSIAIVLAIVTAIVLVLGSVVLGQLLINYIKVLFKK